MKGFLFFVYFWCREHLKVMWTREWVQHTDHRQAVRWQFLLMTSICPSSTNGVTRSVLLFSNIVIVQEGKYPAKLLHQATITFPDLINLRKLDTLN